MSNSSSWPWPSRATTPSTSPGYRSNETSRSFVPELQVPRGDPRDGVRRATALRRTARAGARRAGQVLGDVAEHQRDDPVLGALGHVDDADGLALAQDRRPVADRGDLDQPVRDEDDGAVGALLAADDLEHPLGQVRRQGGGHLVEHQDVGLDRQGAGEVDDPQRGERQVADDVGEVEVGDARARASQWRIGSSGDPGQAQVRADVEVRDERRLLVDGDDAAAPRLGRANWAANGLPRTRIVPPSGRTRAGEDLDEGALAGAVRAHERVDLARADGQRRRAQRHDGAVALATSGGVEQEIGARRSVTSVGVPSWSGMGGGSRSGGAGGAGTPVSWSRCGGRVTRPGPCRR